MKFKKKKLVVFLFLLFFRLFENLFLQVVKMLVLRPKKTLPHLYRTS